MVDLEDKEEEAQTTSVTRTKQCHLETEVRVAAEVGVEELVLGKVGEGRGDSNDYYYNNNNNNNRKKTSLAERTAVTKTIVKSLGGEGEGEVEARPEVGPSGNG